MQDFIPFQDFTPSNIIPDKDFEIILNTPFTIHKYTKNIDNKKLLSYELHKHWKNNNKEYYNKALERWKLKKKSLNNTDKKVLYHSRSIVAMNRPRVGGRFIKKVSTR